MPKSNQFHPTYSLLGDAALSPTSSVPTVLPESKVKTENICRLFLEWNPYFWRILEKKLNFFLQNILLGIYLPFPLSSLMMSCQNFSLKQYFIEVQNFSLKQSVKTQKLPYRLRAIPLAVSFHFLPRPLLELSLQL